MKTLAAAGVVGLLAWLAVLRARQLGLALGAASRHQQRQAPEARKGRAVRWVARRSFPLGRVGLRFRCGPPEGVEGQAGRVDTAQCRITRHVTLEPLRIVDLRDY